MDDLASFLKARLTEDEQVIARNRGRCGLGDDGNFPDYRTYSDDDTNAADDYLGHFAPPRMQADVDAKRKLLDWLVECELAVCASDWRSLDVAAAIRALALPYADHDDYREQWRPDV